MPAPILLAIPALKMLGAIAAKAALKAFFVSKMAGLQSFLASTLGASAAQLSVGVLAAGAAAAYWEKKVLNNTDDDAVAAAAAQGMGLAAARKVVEWIKIHL